MRVLLAALFVSIARKTTVGVLEQDQATWIRINVWLVFLDVVVEDEEEKGREVAGGNEGEFIPKQLPEGATFSGLSRRTRTYSLK